MPTKTGTMGTEHNVNYKQRLAVFTFDNALVPQCFKLSIGTSDTLITFHPSLKVRGPFQCAGASLRSVFPLQWLSFADFQSKIHTLKMNEHQMP